MTGLVVLEKMGMLVLLMAVGFAAAKANWVGDGFNQATSRLVANVFLPASILSSVIGVAPLFSGKELAVGIAGTFVLFGLCAVGGLDIAAMTGAFLGCARERIPAAVDGFISVVAALCAVTLCPEVRDYLFLSHASYEVGYRLAADRLGLEPCLHLGMRLGEGSGCPLLFRVFEGACGVMAGMATFAQAAIQDDYLDEIRAGDSFTVDKP